MLKETFSKARDIPKTPGIQNKKCWNWAHFA